MQETFSAESAWEACWRRTTIIRRQGVANWRATHGILADDIAHGIQAMWTQLEDWSPTLGFPGEGPGTARLGALRAPSPRPALLRGEEARGGQKKNVAMMTTAVGCWILR